MQYGPANSQFAIRMAREAHDQGVTEISPQTIDGVFSMGAYWGRDLQKTSDWVMGKPPVDTTDYPIIGTLVNSLSINLARSNETKREFSRLMQDDKGYYMMPLNSYRDIPKKGAPYYGMDQKQFLDTQVNDEQRAFIYLTDGFEEQKEKLHPLYVAEEATKIIWDMQKEMVFGGIADSTEKPEKAKPGQPVEKKIFPVSPEERAQLDNILGMLSMWTQSNAMIAIKHKHWAAFEPFDTNLTLNELYAASPSVYNELMRRWGSAMPKKPHSKTRIPLYDPKKVAEMWPAVKAEILKNGYDAKLSAFEVDAKATSITKHEIPRSLLGAAAEPVESITAE